MSKPKLFVSAHLWEGPSGAIAIVENPATLLTNHSAALDHRRIMVDRNLSESQILRLENIFREAFGRELTSEERKFLGLSVVAAPPDENEQLSSRKASA